MVTALDGHQMTRNGRAGAALAVAAERKVSKTPERFGKGAIEGVAGPGAANERGHGGGDGQSRSPESAWTRKSCFL